MPNLSHTLNYPEDRRSVLLTTRRHFPEDSILQSLSSNNFYWTQNAYSSTLHVQGFGNEEKRRWIWGSIKSLDTDFGYYSLYTGL